MKNGKHKRWEGYWNLTVNRLCKTVNRLTPESNILPKHGKHQGWKGNWNVTVNRLL